ncbi:hypothetical protein [Sinomonas sp. ASV322]|nr:hypothetical protein [Sinomonas sp. ASV322]MDQ4501700.1 hypothetical protein [Sinomonas sp. ASV322]
MGETQDLGKLRIEQHHGRMDFAYVPRSGALGEFAVVAERTTTAGGSA